MAIPDFQTIMLPLLKSINDKSVYSNNELVNLIIDNFAMTEEEKNETYNKENNNKNVFYDRVLWARTYLQKAGLLEYPQRARTQITNIGLNVLKKEPNRIDMKFLSQFESYNNFRNSGFTEKEQVFLEVEKETKSHKTPDEMITDAQIEFTQILQEDLLSKLKKVDPIRFERIVLDLMEKMNYGVGSMTKASHDGGIDGIINEDELGLEKIYLQAKRYADNKVNEKEMQNFAGALGCSNVRKGVFITTSFFDEKAKRKAESMQGKVLRLIDGKELTKLMIKHGVGVQSKITIEIKKIDEDFFDDEA